MPPINVGGGIGTLRDSGIGDDYPSPAHNNALKDSSNGNLKRNETDRSSFGMILKVDVVKNKHYMTTYMNSYIPFSVHPIKLHLFKFKLYYIGQVPTESKYVLSW